MRRLSWVISCLAMLACSGKLPAEEPATPPKEQPPADVSPDISPEQKKANTDKCRVDVIQRAIALVTAGAKPSADLKVFGRVSSVQIDSATADSLLVIYDEDFVEIPWKNLDNLMLSQLLLKLAGESPQPADILRAGILIRIGGDADAGNSVMARAFASADAAQSETLKTIRDGVFGKKEKFEFNLPAGTQAGKPPPSAPGEKPSAWAPTGLCGGGSMFKSAISPLNPDWMMVNCDMSGQYITRDGGRTWRMTHHLQLSSNTDCGQAFHPTDPNVIYAADNVLKVTRDGGETWKPIGNLPGHPEGKIGIDHDNPSLMLMGASGGVYISTNAGEGWKKCVGPTGAFLDFHFDRTSNPSQRIIYAATVQGIWKSADGGTAWTQKIKGLPGGGIKAFAGGSRMNPATKKKEIILYCTTPTKAEGSALSGGVYASFDEAETWTPAMGKGINVSAGRKSEFALADVPQYPFVLTTDVDPNIVYAVCFGNGFYPPENTTIYRSNDAGKTWEATFFPDPRFKGKFNLDMNWSLAGAGQWYFDDFFGAAIAPSDPNRVEAQRGKPVVTDDGGKTWRCMFSKHKPGSADAGLDADWVCNGLVVTSTWNYYVDPFEKNRHYICYTDIGFARSIDAGQSWKWFDVKTFAPWKNTTYELAFDPEIPGKIWGAFSDLHDIPNNNIISGKHGNQAPGGVCVSVDFAATWKTSNQGLPEAACTGVVIDPKSPKGNRTLYCGVFDYGVYKSVDDGKTWVKKSDGLGAPPNMRVCRVVLHKDGTLFALITAKMSGETFLKEGVGLYRSANGGDKWECITGGKQFLWPKDFNVDPDNSQVIFLGNTRQGEGGGLFKTADGGKSWSLAAKQGSEHFGAYFHPNRKGWIYMTLCEGAPGPALWLSKDGGGSFEPFADFPFSNAQRVYVDPQNDNKIYVCTFGASVWVGPAEPTGK